LVTFQSCRKLAQATDADFIDTGAGL
jgi:hypothetical protein